MTERKIIQISTLTYKQARQSYGTDDIVQTTALCDDGTVWCRTNGMKGWNQLPGIPQPSAEGQTQ